MKTVYIFAALVALVGCGASEEATAEPRVEPAADDSNATEDDSNANEAPPEAIDDPIVGAWTGSMDGGPISATVTYTFAADGTYRMEGYPSIAERGRWSIASREGGTYQLALSDRMRCGPCEDEGPNEPAEDAVEEATLEGDRLSFRRWDLERLQRGGQ